MEHDHDVDLRVSEELRRHPALVGYITGVALVAIGLAVFAAVLAVLALTR